MRFSQQVRYAVCGLFDLAYNGYDEPVQVRVISERQGIPSRYLEQIFARLRRAGLVKGKRGPRGGFMLARDPREISLRDVVEAIEGPIRTVSEPTPRNGEVDAPEAERSQPEFLWIELAERFGDLLASLDLETICRSAAREAVPRASLTTIHDYQI